MKKQSNTSETMVKKVETGVPVGGYVLADSPLLLMKAAPLLPFMSKTRAIVQSR
ncbi:urease subunit beta [Klebsiella pneumoniae]|uniref:Urease subunit beta n=1 Tax=Klebsiella pneumoniae TaxID=573 RepID=A0A377TZ92_KLEPN|nr:urease subunit beta [Klebsiella pneumoniae]